MIKEVLEKHVIVVNKTEERATTVSRVTPNMIRRVCYMMCNPSFSIVHLPGIGLYTLKKYIHWSSVYK